MKQSKHQRRSRNNLLHSCIHSRSLSAIPRMQQHRQRLDHLASSLEFRPSQTDLLPASAIRLRRNFTFTHHRCADAQLEEARFQARQIAVQDE